MKSGSLFLASMLCTSLALAEPPAAPAATLQEAASALVQKQLIAPLARAGAKRSRFSRAAPVPVQRRVRVLDGTAQTDARGKSYVRFAIDVRRGWDDDELDPWQNDAITGCAYLDDAELFVHRAGAYFPAKSLLGAKADARAQVCRPAPNAQLAAAAP